MSPACLADKRHPQVNSRAILGRYRSLIRLQTAWRLIFVAFVEDNATMSSIRYSENRVTYFAQNRRK